MRSRTLHLPPGPCRRELLLEAVGAEPRAPDFALAFLPPDAHLRDSLTALAAAWPDTLRFGCEAVTQFADHEMTQSGTVQVFWFADPRHAATVEVLTGTHGEPPARRKIQALARHLAGADGALLLVDGLRFPAEELLAELRQELGGQGSQVAGGLASQAVPVAGNGARVFVGDRILPSACLAVLLRGVTARLEVVRGWSPASPVYTVTRGCGAILQEIDGEPATTWYRRFFTVDGELAPMPATAYRFPLIVEGPRPERQGVYRSMRAFDEPPGAVTLWGSIETGDRIRLGMGNDMTLAKTAASLEAGLRAEAAILYSCVGREQVLGAYAGLEVANIHETLGGVPLSGFFTFGEIGPTPTGGLAYYNQTAILVLLNEVAP
jgi:hypothetical protein